ncbi:hypothetical protein F1880_010073 [Penicillium rolfsii]|nr:hypothetical protein F1880_010073 [Penicillium rolfsii]
MADAARPSDDEFSQVLQESRNTWTSYLGSESEGDLFPQHAVDLKSLIVRTSPFLGDGFVSSEEISFFCEEKPSSHGTGSLVINGQSTWRTSKGTCNLQPRVLRKQLLLAVGSRLNVRLSENSPFSNWPGVQGGNYISVLFFAWAYILSARWVEALSRSADHDCQMEHNVQAENKSSPTNEQSTIQIGEEDSNRADPDSGGQT